MLLCLPEKRRKKRDPTRLAVSCLLCHVILSLLEMGKYHTTPCGFLYYHLCPFVV